jgi:two-component system chemotaxis response regulator CheY
MAMAKLIMIVDDSASLRQVVGIALKGAGYDVVEACDGKDALGKLNGTRFNLIISDVNMPNMDGVTFLTELKKLPDHRFTPVIMLTTEGAEEMKKKGREAGAKAWVVKPFKPDQMLDAVSRLMA